MVTATVPVHSKRSHHASRSPGPRQHSIDQPWLDGINAGEGFIRQFVAAPLGQGFTVESQVTGKETEGGIQLTVVEPMAGRFPDRPPRAPRRSHGISMMVCESAPVTMGLAAGGRMEQKIYPDSHGLDTWNPDAATSVNVHIVNSDMYYAITGEPAPPSPISARTYMDFGLPWFRLYDEHRTDIAAPDALARVKSIDALQIEMVS